jgi:hypothetical protein
MKESRRSFLKKTAAASAITAANSLLNAYGANKDGAIVVVSDPDDPVAKELPVQWAIEQLVQALKSRSIPATVSSNITDVPSGAECILVASRSSKFAGQLLNPADLSTLNAPESLALVRGKFAKRIVLLASGADARGLVYALLELADRAQLAPDPLADFKDIKRIVQKPANQIRCISRIFASDVEDKSWFNDRSFWRQYLTLLATHRFNRFSLNLGLGYDFTTEIRDCYFHFSYPFLVSPPGYSVRAVPLPDDERERNLEMLRFISEETVRRGLQFQLGLWTHAYKWTNSPDANFVIEGLTPETHAPYCRDALTMLLKACPAIGGVTLRIHGESGVAEGSYDFWKQIFHAAAGAGRKMQIDLHAKGIDQQMIDLALETGMPVTVAPKFWAEHMGLGYMQGSIRPQEMPPRERNDKGFFSKSNGSRRFLRYGYGDLLDEDRRYGVLHRIWPGTQRLLLWGDPEMAAAYGRASSFCGSLGVDWFEPLSFKGRKGSGLSGGRNAYSDPSLSPTFDFEKFAYSYRVWGRRIYDPECAPDEWQRYLTANFGPAAGSMESALANASRILPLVTTAHCPSAANNNYWPEMYTNMPIVDARRPHPYGDTPSPKRFGTVSPLDPEFFLTVDDYATNLVQGKQSAKLSPVAVASFLEILAAKARSSLGEARSKCRKPEAAEFRRAAADVEIMCGLANFFAAKLRAATLFAVYDQTKYGQVLHAAIETYEKARAAWAAFADPAKQVYREDVTFGPGKFQRGHWLDRLPAMDADLADLQSVMIEKTLSSKLGPDLKKSELPATLVKSIVINTAPAIAALPAGFHSPPAGFRRGESIAIEASVKGISSKLDSIILHFRRVNQVEVWQTIPMAAEGTAYRVSIPAAYTDSPFPLQYYFELRDGSGQPSLFPGLDIVPKRQPYFVVTSRA